MGKKKIIAGLFSFGAITLVVALFILYFPNTQKNTEQVGTASNMDYATQKVISEDLLLKKNLEFTNHLLTMTGIYFDGVRLYIAISNNGFQTEKITDPALFKIQSGNSSYIADLLIDQESISKVSGDESNIFLIVFNAIDSGLSNCILTYDESEKTDAFDIGNDKAELVKLEIAYEEIYLNYVQYGTTSTLVNCKITAFIDAGSFQFQTIDGVYPAYVVHKKGNNFSILIPLQLQEKSEGTLISNSNNGNVELRVPIKFEKGDDKSLM